MSEIFNRANQDIFGGQLPSDLEIRWNERMTSTAGYSSLFYDGGEKKARIELAGKILDSPERVRDILGINHI